jgi:hypothetical protein
VEIERLGAVRGTGNGIEVEARVFLVHTMQAGKVARIQIFQDERQALTAAGLSE